MEQLASKVPQQKPCQMNWLKQRSQPIKNHPTNTCAKYRFLFLAMFEKLKTSKPAWPPPPVANIRMYNNICTVDGQENGKRHGASNQKDDHHRPEITKEKITILMS